MLVWHQKGHFQNLTPKYAALLTTLTGTPRGQAEGTLEGGSAGGTGRFSELFLACPLGSE